MDMKNCGRRNVRKHKDVRGSDKYVTLKKHKEIKVSDKYVTLDRPFSCSLNIQAD